jgi:hypothetical protein
MPKKGRRKSNRKNPKGATVRMGNFTTEKPDKELDAAITNRTKNKWDPSLFAPVFKNKTQVVPHMLTVRTTAPMQYVRTKPMRGETGPGQITARH